MARYNPAKYCMTSCSSILASVWLIVLSRLVTQIYWIVFMCGSEVCPFQVDTNNNISNKSPDINIKRWFLTELLTWNKTDSVSDHTLEKVHIKIKCFEIFAAKNMKILLYMYKERNWGLDYPMEQVFSKLMILYVAITMKKNRHY